MSNGEYDRFSPDVITEIMKSLSPEDRANWAAANPEFARVYNEYPLFQENAARVKDFIHNLCHLLTWIHQERVEGWFRLQLDDDYLLVHLKKSDFIPPRVRLTIEQQTNVRPAWVDTLEHAAGTLQCKHDPELGTHKITLCIDPWSSNDLRAARKYFEALFGLGISRVLYALKAIPHKNTGTNALDVKKEFTKFLVQLGFEERVAVNASTTQQGQGAHGTKVKHRGRAYTVRTGKRGGRYILVQGAKIYIRK